MSFHYSPKIITDGLVFAVDAANKKSYSGSGTAWNDLSGSNNNGTLTNGPTFNSSNLGYIEFNGEDDYCSFPGDSIPTGNEISICLWYNGNATAYNLATSAFASINTNDGREVNVHLPWSNNIIYWDCGQNGAGGFVADRITKSVTSNEFVGWNYWVFWKNANTGVMRIYRNGEIWHSGTGKTISIGTSVSFWLGAYPTGQYYDICGISNVMIYNRALSSDEITQNYNALKGRFGL